MIFKKILKLNRRLFKKEITPSFYLFKIKRGIIFRLREYAVSIKLFRKIMKRRFPVDKVITRQKQTDDNIRIRELTSEGDMADSTRTERSGGRPDTKKNKYNYIAEYNDKIVGRIGMARLWKMNHNIDGYVISGTYISNWFRGLGIGEALHKALIEESKKDNLDTIYQTIFNTNRRNIKLAEKLGFKRADRELEDKVCGRAPKNRKRLLAFRLDLKESKEVWRSG